MAKLWKGIRNVFGAEKDNFFTQPYNVFSKEMTIKLVFVGGHQSGKSAIVKVLNKEKFPENYIPTIGIDQYKVRLDISSENTDWLWLWDVSHAELGGVHESLIFHQAHGIVLVADLTNFSSIQAVDEWLHSISNHLKTVLDHSMNDKDSDSDIESEMGAYDSNDDSNNNGIHSISEQKQDGINDNNNNNDTTTTTTGTGATGARKKHKKKNKNKNRFGNVWMPRIYLLVSKYDQSDEPILTDKELHKFCKSNSIRAFARISAKLDSRNDMLEIFETFANDIMKHCPIQQPYSNILKEENDRFRYYYAIKRMQKNKLASLNSDAAAAASGGASGGGIANNNTIFDVKLNEMKTFKWGENVNVLKSDKYHSDDSDNDDESISSSNREDTNEDGNTNNNNDNNSESGRSRENSLNNIINNNNHSDKKDELDSKRVLKNSGIHGSNAQKKLIQCEQEARRVLLSMRECVEIQKEKCQRDLKEYGIKQRKILQNQLLYEKTNLNSNNNLANNNNNSVSKSGSSNKKLIDLGDGKTSITITYNKNTIDNNNDSNSNSIFDSGSNQIIKKTSKFNELSKKDLIYKNKYKEKLIEFDVISKLKMEMLNGLESEIDNLTECWEDELNTIVEMIRFQMPLSQISNDIHKLSQQIIAREMIFKRRLRLVYSLQSPNRDDLNQIIINSNINNTSNNNENGNNNSQNSNNRNNNNSNQNRNDSKYYGDNLYPSSMKTGATSMLSTTSIGLP